MNDLNYSDWMKFQKSFFRHESDESLVDELVYFFTKETWEDGTASRSLLLVKEPVGGARPYPDRDVVVRTLPKMTEVAGLLVRERIESGRLDFAVLDLRSALRDSTGLRELHAVSDSLFEALRNLLAPERYCAVLVEADGNDRGSMPIPWALAVSARDHLRLRDEKVGIQDRNGQVLYVLIFQATGDERPSERHGDDLAVASSGIRAPSWIIPKPPPRKRNEVLHPAKFPETLVERFIELFTQPGDSILDPMAGTGSTLLAATRRGRNGLGIELIPRFVEIATDRLMGEPLPLLTQASNVRVIQGDATKLADISELRDVCFNYAITSPPYWSMLRNPGSENQKSRRDRNLATVYSDDHRDLGNVDDYDRFLELLTDIYSQVATVLESGSILTVVVKNVKRDHVLYPLAWDLTWRLCRKGGPFEYAGTTLWCQDDIGLKPFAVGTHWVSNILHNYCLHFLRV